VATLSLDEHFKRWHAQQAAYHVRHRNMTGQFRPRGHAVVVSAVSRPIQDIIMGVVFAATGVIVEPFNGARTNGTRGLAKGIGIGAVGTVTKPLVGMFDAFAHISESINDVARSANFFDKKFKPVTRRRYPYTFGCNSILLPYNPVDARTTNLLHLYGSFSGERGNDHWNEILVMSELLLLYPGEATYIAVTTRRIVLFELKINDATPVKILWQIDIDDDVKITSTVENYRHNGFVLRIRRVPILDSPSALSTKESKEIIESNHSALAMNPDNPKPHTNKKGRKKLAKWEERNFKKIYEQAGALLPNVAFTSRPEEMNPIYAEVLAEYEDNKELTRVHNAICCLTNQFDMIMDVTANSNDLDGCTSFRNSYFVEEDFSTKVSDPPKDKLFEHLEHIPWVHFEVLQDSTDDIATMRRRWLYSDELEVSKGKGGPSWVIESRTRCKLISIFVFLITFVTG
jgi:hypothetical protein